MSKYAITIGRQFGSGGKDIGMHLAKELGIKCYDKEIIKLASKSSGLSEKIFEKADERPVNSFLYSVVTNGFPAYSTPMQVNNVLTDDKIFNIQAKTIAEVAERESAVFIGRCADDILKDSENLIKVFIYADKEIRANNIKERYGVSEKEAYEMIRRMDKSRSSYYEFFANKKWGDKQVYDLCIDSYIGIDKTAAVIKSYMTIKGVLN